MFCIRQHLHTKHIFWLLTVATLTWTPSPWYTNSTSKDVAASQGSKALQVVVTCYIIVMYFLNGFYPPLLKAPTEFSSCFHTIEIMSCSLLVNNMTQRSALMYWNLLSFWMASIWCCTQWNNARCRPAGRLSSIDIVGHLMPSWFKVYGVHTNWLRAAINESEGRQGY